MTIERNDNVDEFTSITLSHDRFKYSSSQIRRYINLILEQFLNNLFYLSINKEVIV